MEIAGHAACTSTARRTPRAHHLPRPADHHPRQTLLDLAATEPPGTTERALNEAHAQRLVTRPGLLAFLARHERKPGSVRLEALVEGGEGFTRKEAERRLRELIRKARLPPARHNAKIHGYEVDVLWPEHRLVVEVDGYAFHSSPTASSATTARRPT